MESKHWTGDDDREFSPPPDQEHGDGMCECHCDTCGAELSLDPIFNRVYARCGDCYGGSEPDGEAFRGGEAAAYEREQMAHIQRTLK